MKAKGLGNLTTEQVGTVHITCKRVCESIPSKWTADLRPLKTDWVKPYITTVKIFYMRKREGVKICF